MAALPLKYIVLCNWFLAIWAMFAPFLGTTYIFANATVFALGVWCLVDKHTIEGFTSFGAAYVFSIISDFMCIGVWAKQNHISDNGDNNEKFALAMACINLIMKFVFLYFLWVEYNSRGSASVDGSTSAPLAHGAYDPISHGQNQPIGGFQAAAGSFGQPSGALPPVMSQAPQPIGANAGMQGVMPSGSVSGSVGGAYQQTPQGGYTGM